MLLQVKKCSGEKMFKVREKLGNFILSGEKNCFKEKSCEIEIILCS